MGTTFRLKIPEFTTASKLKHPAQKRAFAVFRMDLEPGIDNRSHTGIAFTLYYSQYLLPRIKVGIGTVFQVEREIYRSRYDDTIPLETNIFFGNLDFCLLTINDRDISLLTELGISTPFLTNPYEFSFYYSGGLGVNVTKNICLNAFYCVNKLDKMEYNFLKLGIALSKDITKDRH